MVDIVGRIPQRAQLSRWLIAAISGQPAVVVLDGPPGVGKSTLVDGSWPKRRQPGRRLELSLYPSAETSADDLGDSHRRNRRTDAPQRAAAAGDRRRALARRRRPAPGRTSCVSTGDRGGHWSAGTRLSAAGGAPGTVAPDVSSGRRADHPTDESLDARRSRSPRAGPADHTRDHRSANSGAARRAQRGQPADAQRPCRLDRPR